MPHVREHPGTGTLVISIGDERVSRLDEVLATARSLGRRVQPDETLARALDAWLDDAERQLDRLRRDRERLAAATEAPIVMGPAPCGAPGDPCGESGTQPQAQFEADGGSAAREGAVQVRRHRYPRPA